MRVLVVEDSANIRDAVTQALREAGYATDAVADGRQGLIHAQTTDYDVVVLDLGLPEVDGMTLLRTIRAKGINVHVLVLTARDAVEDRVSGLGAGADDYLVKPFALAELLARVGALARRAQGTHSALIRAGPLTLDTAAKCARVGKGRELALSPREYSLLEYLACRKGKPVSRAELEEHLYDERSQVMSNAVDSAVCALRSKLEGAGCPALIHTRRKVGYVFGEEAPS